MLRKNILHLLEPAAADVAGPGAMTKSWIASLPSLSTPVDDGTGGGDPGAGAEPGKGGDGKAVDDGGAATPPGDGVAPKPDPAAKPAAQPPKAAASGAAPPDKGAGAEDGDERLPRSNADWTKFKEKRAAEKAELKAQLKEREAKLAEVEARIAEVEAKAGQQIDPAIAKELEAYKKENEELSNRISVLDVTQHPRFENYFGKKIKEAHDDAKAIVGNERGEEFIKILNQPDGEWKTNQLNEFYSNLTPAEQAELGAVRVSLRATERERQEEIRKANETKERLVKDRTDADGKLRATYDQTITAVVKDLMDPKTGFAAFQKKPDNEDGAPEWNAAVDKRIADAKARLMGRSTPAQIVRTAFDAAALPAVLEAYQQEQAEWEGERKKFQAQIKELTAAQPNGAGAGGGSAAKPNPNAPNPGDAPSVLSKKWGEDFARRMTTPVEQ